ncbi:MAG TPA: archease [Anaeromyxobacteraceae bacterium]|nr:archease [Anaeromyxobacteraceae bacterium]
MNPDGPGRRLDLPQPWEEVSHTADLGIAARGATPGEALCRLVLAFGALVAGGGPVRESEGEALVVTGGADLAQTAVEVMREVLYRLATRGLVPCGCAVDSLRPGEARLRIWSGPRDPALHGEGADPKAVTWHAARLEPDGGGWRAQVILDV